MSFVQIVFDKNSLSNLMDDLFVCCEEIGLPFKCNVLQTLNSFFDILSGADNKTQEQRRKIGEEEKFAEKAPQKIDNIIISVKLSSCIIAGIKVQIEFHVFLGWKSKRLILVGYLEKSNKFDIGEDDDDNDQWDDNEVGNGVESGGK